ncbi:TetR/AcrR family transcriptional regulator [Alkalihalobacillus sp. AL-G]|uniref:TetR/AcrR family transcriptional regulator n=1 Tax=Alkalihalobacillus sp. AL-G TaxID=2926399 RepID=UPI00272B4957|nr:TetR/AcrR family transcriptional regulator [Alkalihalobacillus sp. AL-G]WLD94795.1 TetR/AcrR family transcriptional regulator [Alkalihalobacillus sp. AL-G]
MNFDEWVGEFFQVLDEEKMTPKQKQILLAAVEVFAEKGYAGTSTSEIAKKAGVAEGTIFRHYKTKKELLLSIVAPVVAKLVAPFVIENIRKVIDQDFPSYEDFLRALIKNRIEFLRSHFRVIKIFMQEIPFHDELKEQFQHYVAENVLVRFQSIVSHFQDRGELIDLPAISIIRHTASVIGGLLIARFLIVPDAEWEEEQVIEETIQMLLYGIKAKEKYSRC